MTERSITARRWLVIASLLGSIPVIGSVAAAPPGVSSLAETNLWTWSSDEAVTLRGSRLRIEMGVVRGTRWQPDVILAAVRRAAAILVQCDIHVSAARLHEFDGPPAYRKLWTPVSREFARRSQLGKPAIFFVDDTLQRPAFDAEAVGRGNSRSRPEMIDTVWITAGTRDLEITLAHELVHVLSDSGSHSEAPRNLMRDETAPENTHLTPEQCDDIVRTGTANGLLDASPSGGRR